MKKTFLFLAAALMSAMTWAVDGTYKLCTSTDDLVAGEHYIIANGVDGDVYCMATESNANNRKKVSATVSESAIEVAEESGILTLTLGGESGAWTFYTDNYAGNNGYLASASSGNNNYCRVIADLTTATITFSEGSAAVINLQPHASRTLLRYNPNGMFACYASGQNPVYLYKKDSATPTPATLDSLVIKGKATKMEYEVGEAFDTDGLEVWGIYTKTVKHDSTSQITKGIAWSIDPETFEEASDNASVTLVASYKDLTSADTTITGIKVNEPAPLSEYAYIYTSNVTLGKDTVIIDQVKYGALKIAKNTPVKITVPAGTKTLHIHAAAWNGEACEWTISGLTKDVKINAVADAGVSGNSPFTLQNDPVENDYFAIETNNNTEVTLTFTLPTGKRGVLFGVNAELQEGVIAAPVISAKSTEFDESVEVSISCETEGAEIYYTLDGSDPTAASTKYEAPFTLTETTTVKAIAIKGGKASEVTEKTFTKTVFASLEELVTKFPAKSTTANVTVTLTDVRIDSILSTNQKGIFTDVKGTLVELYANAVLPKGWEVGGTISGTIKAEWILYNGVPELQKWDGGWDALTYSAPVSEADLVSITLSLDKDTLYLNKEFKYNGKVTANYDDESTKDVTELASYTGYDMTTPGDQTVTVSYTEGEVTKEAQYALTVVEKVLPEYATIYTSNVEFTEEGGSKATLAKVVVAEGDTVKAIKCGTGSVDGSCVITIPAATKTLHFHAVAWTGKPTTMDVNGTIFDVVPDAGIAGTGTTFTLAGDPADYYFSFDPKGATTITFTAKSDHRFVLYGVNAELEEGIVAAPAFTPTDTDFDGSVEVTLTCETEGAEIFYALNEEVTSMNAIKYTEPIELTETTTIYAVAKKDGKESEQASKTYTLIPAYTLAELVAAGAPTADKKKVILVLENEVITGIDGTRGIYLMSNDQEIEIFCYNLPTTAVKGGTVSGRAMGDWFLYGTKDPKKWELQPANWDWATFETSPTRINNPKANKVAKKAIVNGQIMIIRDNRTYNVLGF